MRFKAFILFAVLSFSLLALGCGGGGGGGGGGTTGTSTPTTYNVSGNVQPPPVSDSWNPSIRAAFSLSSLTATAIGKSGTSLGSKAVDSNGNFTIPIVPDDDVTIKVTNSKGFEFRKKYGKVAADVSGISVTATSTAELILQESGLATSGVPLTNLINAIISALSNTYALTSGQNLYDVTKTNQNSTISFYQTAQTAISSRNSLLETALKNADVDGAVQYFSASFTSSDPALQATVNRDHFKSVTQDRFSRYTITTYTVTITKIEFTATDTANVTITARVAATGKDGSSPDVTLSNKVVVWRFENSNWYIYKDFPYLRDQLF